MLSLIKNKVILLLQLILVITYIIFEELIWEGIAKPIYVAIHSLKILQRLEAWLQNVNAKVVLFIFVLLLIVVEVAGIYAGILFVSGHVALGLALYISKIPIAAFTFWLFRATEEKLMQFDWFKWLYEQIMKAIDWLKSREMYKKTMERLKSLKKNISEWKKDFITKYFSNKSLFVEKIKRLYKTVKEALSK
jgi:membrane-bound ClpP family serine protease